MLLVKTKLAPSKIHGIGLFADQPIVRGTIIWQHHFLTCSTFSLDQFQQNCEELPLCAIQNLLNYSYLKNSIVHYISDNTRFINHDLNPNIAFAGNQVEYALKDIEKGEEILENYFVSYDDNDFFKYPELFITQNKSEVLETLHNLYAHHSYLS